MIRTSILLVALVLYGICFALQEKYAGEQEVVLKPSLPANYYRIVAGYTRQLTAEMLFIRTGVFLGGVKPGTPHENYERALANNLEVTTELYPRFLDPYFYTNSFLPIISEESASRAACIFENGIAANPENLILRFFYGTNFFLAMDEPLKAARAFSDASELSDAPPMFSRIAAILSAQGGEIAAGLMSLKTMHAAEENEMVRARYEEEIAIFEQALEVQQALKAYMTRYGSAPETLDQLVPMFIDGIPEIKDSLVMEYSPPDLHLKRPTKKLNR
ncbi:hypothetical protein [Desulfopila inferna]|uniref:hypothetical protein n=1 Tax=Desulfopila inferna TaxID=468528 RepID=UPI001966BB2B|nr:hypothetical protein [Desulfopila inferna]MBM9603177.1 hypothetical protein [Desulfopila inferna]